MLNMKKRVSVTFIATLILALAVIGWGALQPAAVSAAKAPASTVGIVDYAKLVDQHPDADKADAALKAENEQAGQEYESKAATLNDQEKQQLANQLSQRIELKRRQLLSDIMEKVDAAVKAVADEKGLTVVVLKSAAVTGGVDITNDVLAKAKKMK